MKKIFGLFIFFITIPMSFISCSNDEEKDAMSMPLEQYITGKRWKEPSHKGEYWLYRNHLVVYNGGASNLTSGMLTYMDSFFLGSWRVNGNKLITTFTSGSFGGFDWNEIMYGTLVEKNREGGSRIMFEKPDGQTEWFNNINTFIDYTDDSSHDRAVHGTWEANITIDNKPAKCMMDLNGDGTAHFIISDYNVDFTTKYTTHNGHVNFDSYMVPNNTSGNSYIYLRENDNTLNFVTEDTAIRVWSWSIK